MRNSTEFRFLLLHCTISTSLDFRGLVKGRLVCIALCPSIVQITMCFFLSRSLVTPRHLWVIMNKVVNESLRKICYYQQNGYPSYISHFIKNWIIV